MCLVFQMRAKGSVKEKKDGGHVNLAKGNGKEEWGWEVFQRHSWQNYMAPWQFETGGSAK